MKLWAIRSKDGLWYKPTYGDKFWKSDLKKAKIYTNKGHAKTAITYKLQTLESLESSRERYGDSRWDHSLEAHKRFRDCEIVEAGEMIVNLSPSMD